MRGWILSLLVVTAAGAGEWPRELTAYRGTTPVVDGVLSEDEYADATTFTADGWIPQFSPTTDPEDLSLEGWVKHDGENLYFAFRVTDDVLYGLDTPRWLPENNPHAHELSRRGWPWFGDEMELLINASNTWSADDNENCAGNGQSWQMVCNLTKSRLGGVGLGGLLEGEPRAKESAWETYQRWILNGDMIAVARRETTGEPRGGTYVIEWLVKPNPCLEIRPGVTWSPALGTVRMGLNIALGDLDDPDTAPENFGGFHHEDWFAGEKNKRTWLKQWGTLILEPGARPAAE